MQVTFDRPVRCALFKIYTMDGRSSHCSRRRRSRKYSNANKRKQEFSGVKNLLKAQKALLILEVEKVTKQKDNYKSETVAFRRLVYGGLLCMTGNEIVTFLCRLVHHSKQYSSTSRCLSRISKCTALSSANILKSAPKSIPPGVHCFNDDAVGSAAIVRGTFGTCYLANLGPLKCCKKVHRSEPQWLSYFYNELAMLMQLCHENLPFLYGAYVQENHPKSILMSLHLFAGDGKVLNVEDALSRLCVSRLEVHSLWLTICY